MEADYFVLRLLSITQDIQVEQAEFMPAVEQGRQAFDRRRRDGLDVSTALEGAEAEMVATFTHRLEAATQLRSLLTENFADSSTLSAAAHFGPLLTQLMPLLTADLFRQGNRLADALIIGKIAEYEEQNQITNGV